MSDELPDWAEDLVARARVGHLATANAAAEPHVVVVCFVVIERHVVIPIDEKPKSGRLLARVRNILENGQAAIVFDSYDEDWTQLAWVQARGRARIAQPGDPVHHRAIDLLREKYPQYRAMSLEEAAAIDLEVERWRWWRWTERLASQ